MKLRILQILGSERVKTVAITTTLLIILFLLNALVNELVHSQTKALYQLTLVRMELEEVTELQQQIHALRRGDPTSVNAILAVDNEILNFLVGQDKKRFFINTQNANFYFDDEHKYTRTASDIFGTQNSSNVNVLERSISIFTNNRRS